MLSDGKRECIHIHAEKLFVDQVLGNRTQSFLREKSVHQGYLALKQDVVLRSRSSYYGDQAFDWLREREKHQKLKINGYFPRLSR